MTAQAPTTRRSRLTRVLRVAISLGLLALLFWRGGADFADVVAALGNADPLPLVVAVFCYAALGSIVRGYRWQALVAALGHRFRVLRATELFLVGTFFNQFLPTAIGGDVVRTLMLGREGLGGARAASTVLVDRAVGIIMLLVPGLFALAIARESAAREVVVLLTAAIAAGVCGVAVLLTAHRWRGWAETLPVVGWIAGSTTLTRFVDSFAEYGWRPLAKSAGWSLVFTGLLIAANSLLGRALGLEQASLRDWVLLVPLIALSSLLPSVGGWGVREWTYVGLLGTLTPPVPASQATAVSILFGGMNLILAATGGLLTLLRGSGRLPQVEKQG